MYGILTEETKEDGQRTYDKVASKTSKKYSSKEFNAKIHQLQDRSQHVEVIN